MQGIMALSRRYAGFAAGLTAVVLALLYVPSLATSSRPSGASAPSPPAFGAPVLPPGITPPAAPGTAGYTVGHLKCGPSVRQVPWSAYAPYCVPQYRGDNGGATAPGVTGSTITITYREAVTAEEQALYSLVAPSLVGTNQAVIATMQAYIDEFNKTFELYGRHVVLKPFQGQGDFLQEALGFDQPQAEADAITAKSNGAFADTSILASTQEYDQALAFEHVIGIGALLMPQSWFAQYAPYEYSPWGNCDKYADASADVMGKAMAGLPAIFAGDSSLRSQIRKFGVVYPQVPVYAGCAKEAIDYLANHYGYHIDPNDIEPVEVNLSTLSEQAGVLVARWKQDGVTTVLCACDPLSPIYLTQAADKQDFHPEWFGFSLQDSFGRLPAQDQWAHAVAGGGPTVPKQDQEAYRAYRLAAPYGTPDPSYQYLYTPLLLLFDGLQAAGPDLTPQTFAYGMAHLPPSLPNGMFGDWVFGPHIYDPPNSFVITWWSPVVASPEDGRAGTWRPCNGGATYIISNRAATLPVHRQLDCFGAGS